MSDVYKISQALEDMRNHYGLGEIKHVTLNMEDPDNVFITFTSNTPRQLKGSSIDNNRIKYMLKLSVVVGSIFPEED